METATRAEAPYRGENRDLNLVSTELGNSSDEAKPTVSFISGEFLRHETSLVNDKEQAHSPGKNNLPDIQKLDSPDVKKPVSSDLKSDEARNVPANQPVTDEVSTSDSVSDEQSKDTNKSKEEMGPEPNMSDSLKSNVKQSSEAVGFESEQLKGHESGDVSIGALGNVAQVSGEKDGEEFVKEEVKSAQPSDEDSHSKESSGEPKENEKIDETPGDESPKDEWMDILGSGHLMKKVLVAGIPDSRPNKSDICSITYTGCLEDGTVVDKAENVKIQLNDNEVIQGIDFALSLMDKGEEAEIKVGPRFAFGSLGRKPDIPSGATLHYTIKLHDVQEESPINILGINDRITLGLQKKERGNWWYSRGEHSIAINCYRRALEYLDDTDLPEGHSEEDVARLLEEALKTYNNLGASQMKINAFDAALMSVNKVINAQPKNVKALFRKSKILKEKGELQESINTVRQALSHDPDNQAIQQELSTLLAAQRKANTKQRELYKKMMGTSSSQEKDKDKKSSSKNNYNALKWVTLLSFAVAVIGTIAIKYKT